MALQTVSIAGAILILIAYAAHQSGRLSREDASYHVVNVVGGALLTVVAVATSQIGFIILEGAWTAISLLALSRMIAGRARA